MENRVELSTLSSHHLLLQTVSNLKATKGIQTRENCHAECQSNKMKMHRAPETERGTWHDDGLIQDIPKQSKTFVKLI